jgi:hypothetical protein
MTIPINQLLDSIKSQSENLNAQSKVLHSLSDTIISQRKEFGNVKKDMGDLKKSFAQNLSGISEIKKYLVEKNLIKIGSMAPPNIVRKIYEDAMLTGEIENVGKGVILHNFLEDKKSW